MRELKPTLHEESGWDWQSALSQETELFPSLVTNGAKAGHLFRTMATFELAFCDGRWVNDSQNLCSGRRRRWHQEQNVLFGFQKQTLREISADQGGREEGTSSSAPGLSVHTFNSHDSSVLTGFSFQPAEQDWVVLELLTLLVCFSSIWTEA